MISTPALDHRFTAIRPTYSFISTVVFFHSFLFFKLLYCFPIVYFRFWLVFHCEINRFSARLKRRLPWLNIIINKPTQVVIAGLTYSWLRACYCYENNSKTCNGRVTLKVSFNEEINNRKFCLLALATPTAFSSTYSGDVWHTALSKHRRRIFHWRPVFVSDVNIITYFVTFHSLFFHQK